MDSKQQSIKEEYLQFCNDNGIQSCDGVIEVIDRKSSVLNISTSNSKKHETTDKEQQTMLDRELLSASFALTCQLPQLLQLRIQAIQQYLTRQNITALSWGLSQNNSLLTLSITQCALDDSAVVLLVKSLSEKNTNNRSLQELILSANNLTEIGVSSICECFKDHPSIKRLDFSRNQVKSDSVGVFLQQNKTIEQLDISYNPYDFGSVESVLQGAKSSSSLKELRMSGIVVGSISRILTIQLIETISSLLQILSIDIELNDIEHPKEWRRLEESLRVNCNLKELISSKLLFPEDNPKTNGIAMCLQANAILPINKDQKSLKEYKIRVPNGKLKEIITEKLEMLFERVNDENQIKQISQQLEIQEQDNHDKQQYQIPQNFSKTGQISVVSSTVNASEFLQGQQNTVFEDTLQMNITNFKEDEENNLNSRSINIHSINNNSVSSCHQIHFTEELVSESKRYRDKLKWRNDQQPHKQNSSINQSHESDRNCTQIPSIQQNTDKTQQINGITDGNINTDDNIIINHHHHPILSSQEQIHSTLAEDFRNYPTFQTMASNEQYINENKNIIKIYNNNINSQYQQQKKLQQQTLENQEQEISQQLLLQQIQQHIDSRLDDGFAQIFTILDSQQTSIDLLNLQVRQLQAKMLKQQQQNDITQQELKQDHNDQYDEGEAVFEKIRQFQQRMDTVKRALKFKQTSSFNHSKNEKVIENSSIDAGKSILSSQCTTICPSVLRELPLKTSNRYSSIDRNKNINLSNTKNTNILEVNKSSTKKANSLRSSLKLLRQSNTKQSYQKENISYQEVDLSLVNSQNDKKNTTNNINRIIPKISNCTSAILVEQECDFSNSTSNSCSPDKQSILKIKDLNLSSMDSSSSKSFTSMKVMQNTTTQSGLSRQSEQNSTGLGKPFERVQRLILEGLNGSKNQSDKLLNSTEQDVNSKVFQIDCNNEQNHLLKNQLNEYPSMNEKNNQTQEYNSRSYNSQYYFANTRDNKENYTVFDQCQTGPYRKLLESTGMKKECQNNPSQELIEELRRRGINYDIIN